MNKKILEDEQKKKEEEMRIPTHRIGRPEKIAKVSLFLASDDAIYMTGTTVYVDGVLLCHPKHYRSPKSVIGPKVCLRNSNSRLHLI